MNRLCEKFIFVFIVLLVFFSVLFFNFSNVRAGALSNVKDRLNRQIQNLTSGVVHTFVFTTESAVSGGAGNNLLRIYFPVADDGLWCRTAGSLSVSGCTEEGATALPGSLSASCTQSNDIITITGVNNLSAANKYCVQVDDNGPGDLGTPSASTTGVITIKTNDGTNDIDSAIFAVDIITNDQVTVSASVPSGGGQSGGGGGGGGGEIIISQTEVIFIGVAPPGTLITILKDGQKAVDVIADENGNFQAKIVDIAPGTYLFTIYGKNNEGKTSKPLVFSVIVSEGTITTISGIFIDMSKGITGRGDLNGDNRVDIVDFSILIYWYQKLNPPLYIDLNGDGKIDATDFSILAYYWTG